MKKVMIAAMALAITSGSTAYAAGTIRDNCGCGLGVMVMGAKEPTLVNQFLTALLNGICGNQTFGITFGTLECNPYTSFASNKHIIDYVSDNMDHLVMDIAVGSGESLAALADLMEVPAAERQAVFTTLQSNFDVIFPSEDVTAHDVVTSISQITRS